MSSLVEDVLSNKHHVCSSRWRYVFLRLLFTLSCEEQVSVTHFEKKLYRDVREMAIGKRISFLRLSP